MKKWQKEYYRTISTVNLAQAAHDVGFADGTDGVTRENPYQDKIECAAYERGRKAGAKHYLKTEYDD